MKCACVCPSLTDAAVYLGHMYAHWHPPCVSCHAPFNFCRRAWEVRGRAAVHQWAPCANSLRACWVVRRSDAWASRKACPIFPGDFGPEPYGWMDEIQKIIKTQ